MKIATIFTIATLTSLTLMIGGCGDSLGRLDRKSIFNDPPISRILGVYKNKNYIFINYSVKDPENTRQKKLSPSYWAKRPIYKLSPNSSWEIYREDNPRIISKQKITEVNKVEKTFFVNSDPNSINTYPELFEYANSVYRKKNLDLPLAIISKENKGIYIVLPVKRHSNQEVIYHQPLGHFRDTTKYLLYLPLYPFAFCFDLVFSILTFWIPSVG